MKRLQILIIAFVVVCLLAIIGIAFLAAKREAESSKYTADSLSTAVNKFSFDFYETVSDSKKDANFVYSPFSISATFGILLSGSRKHTAKQLFKALSYNESVQSYYDVQDAFKPLMESVDDVTNYTLLCASKLIIQQYFDVKTKFKKSVIQNFKATLEFADFTKNGPKIVERINRWIAARTRDKITKLFEDPFDEKTKMVIVNAVYFHAKWVNAFNKSLTVKKPFFNTPGLVNQTDFMNLRTSLPFYNNTQKRYTLTELEYHGNVSFFVVLPNDNIDNGLQKLMANLTLEDIEYAINKTKTREVNLYLPKFKIEAEFDLKNATEELGVKDIYENKADFTGISASEQLRVSKAIHKSVIDVNEEGTEAAAATGIVIMGRSYRPVKLIEVNRPFMFFIRNKQTGLIYFMGAVQHF